MGNPDIKKGKSTPNDGRRRYAAAELCTASGLSFGKLSDRKIPYHAGEIQKTDG